MWYMGSKAKIAKDIVPIIQSYINDSTSAYVEPFVGGCNIMDKIKCVNRIGSDINPYLIALLVKLRDDSSNIPDIISLDEYNNVKNNKDQYEDWYVGLVGFCSTFGAKFFGGYGRQFPGDNSGNHSKASIKSLKLQADKIRDVELYNCSYEKLSFPMGSVVYCDIPYRNTTKYVCDAFDYEKFYKWCKLKSVDNIVLISEYDMPDDFEPIYTKQVKLTLDSNRVPGDKCNIRTEKLYTVIR